ncbi:MAG: nucleotidyltransferase domain-containing protein [Phascolarctobacterium sp.]|nr:nucleotidyltransferase domain-containing protein [Phascolarctobacterium sp.]
MCRRLDEIREKVVPIAEKYGLEAVYLFGSQARDDANENSDYDFYIKRGKLRGMFQLSGLFLDLKTCLSKEVDIVIDPEGHKKLDDYISDAIQKDGILIYAQSA